VNRHVSTRRHFKVFMSYRKLSVPYNSATEARANSASAVTERKTSKQAEQNI